VQRRFFGTPKLKKQKMKKTLLIGLGAMAFNANAAVIVQTDTITNGPVPSASFPLTTPFTFNQFDPALGTLNSVTLTIEATASADVIGDNEAASAVSFTANLNGSVAGTIPAAIAATAVLTQSDGPEGVDGDNDAAADFVGTDSHDFGSISDNSSDSDFATTGLAPFIGLGTVGGSVNDTQSWSVSGGGDAVTQVSNSQSTTIWTVTYDYDPVPEPSSALLGLVGLLGLARRRR